MMMRCLPKQRKVLLKNLNICLQEVRMCRKRVKEKVKKGYHDHLSISLISNYKRFLPMKNINKKIRCYLWKPDLKILQFYRKIMKMGTSISVWIASKNKILRKIWKISIKRRTTSLGWNMCHKFPLLTISTQGNVWPRQKSWNKWWVILKKTSWSRYSNSSSEFLKRAKRHKRCVKAISNTLIFSLKWGSRNGTATSKLKKYRKNPLQNKKTNSLPHKITNSFWIKTNNFSR